MCSTNSCWRLLLLHDTSATRLLPPYKYILPQLLTIVASSVQSYHPAIVLNVKACADSGQVSVLDITAPLLVCRPHTESKRSDGACA